MGQNGDSRLIYLVWILVGIGWIPEVLVLQLPSTTVCSSSGTVLKNVCCSGIFMINILICSSGQQIHCTKCAKSVSLSTSTLQICSLQNDVLKVLTCVCLTSLRSTMLQLVHPLVQHSNTPIVLITRVQKYSMWYIYSVLNKSWDYTYIKILHL